MKKLTITGNVGQDAVSRADKEGNIFATFAVGVNVWGKSGVKTDWVEVSCSGTLAEIARSYVKKGGKVLVEGYPATTAYINKDGEPAAVLKLFAHALELMSRNEGGEVAADNLANGGNTHDMAVDV